MEAGVLETAEGEDCRVHGGGVEDADVAERLEVIDRQVCDLLEELGFQVDDHVLEGRLPEVGQLHEDGDTCGELDEVLLEAPTERTELLFLLVDLLLVLLGLLVLVLGFELLEVLLSADGRGDVTR